MRRKRPFLEIVTRCYKRPNSLKVCQASIDAQTDPDWVHTLLIDNKGRGIPWANHNLGAYGPRLEGDYIWILDDDDECIVPTLVADLKGIVAQYEPDVIMLRTRLDPARVVPEPGYWGQVPIWGHVGMSGFVVRREIWQAYADAFPYQIAGDFHFIVAIYAGLEAKHFYWHDVIAARCNRKGHGKPEPTP